MSRFQPWVLTLVSQIFEKQAMIKEQAEQEQADQHKIEEERIKAIM